MLASGCSYSFDDTPTCGLKGVSISIPRDVAHGTRLKVGERLRVEVTVGTPEETLKEMECHSLIQGQTYFPRVEWLHDHDGPFEVELVSCPCEVDYVRDTNAGPQATAAQAAGPGTFVFDIVGVRPGFGLFGFSAYLGGPCGGTGPSDPVKTECGNSTSVDAPISVVAD